MGGVIGLLAGVGALVIPGIGPIIAAGALASTLTGAGIDAAAGGLIGALAGMGIPDADAKHFERGFQEGGVLVTVQAGEGQARARQALIASDADLGPAHDAMQTARAAAARRGPAGTERGGGRPDQPDRGRRRLLARQRAALPRGRGVRRPGAAVRQPVGIDPSHRGRMAPAVRPLLSPAASMLEPANALPKSVESHHRSRGVRDPRTGAGEPSAPILPPPRSNPPAGAFAELL